MKKIPHLPQHRLKYALIVAFLLALCIASMLILIYRNNVPDVVAQNIISEVDASENAACQIDLETVTDFEWDRVIVVSADFFAAGYSPETIKDMWGIDYGSQSKYRARLIFVRDDEVVYEESYAASIEKPLKFNISVSPNWNYYRILPHDNSTVSVEKSDLGFDGSYSLMIDE